MFDALSIAELEGQRVELLPPRTVLSMFSRGTGGGNSGNGGGPLGLLGVENLLHGNGYASNGSNADGSSGAENS